VSAGDAVLLDIDGTLIDSTYHHAIAWQRAFARHDLVLPTARVHRAIGMGGDKLVAHVTDDETEERLGDALRDAWREEYLSLRREVRPLDGAADLVRALRASGLRVALASSGDPEFSREAVEMLGIGDDIELLTTSEDVEDSKPDPDLLGETIRRLGGVDRAVLVGDRRHQPVAAHADRPVDAPERWRAGDPGEGAVPRDSVVVRRVDERAVDVEQDCRRHAAPGAAARSFSRSGSAASERKRSWPSSPICTTAMSVNPASQ